MKSLWLGLGVLACGMVVVAACGDDEGGSGGSTNNGGTTTTNGGTGGMPAGGGSAGGAGGITPPGPMALTSPDFAEGEMIPAQHECGNSPMGMDVSPQLNWTLGPLETLSYAIVMRDLDYTPVGSPEGFVHWVVFDIPTTALSLPQGIPVGFNLPEPSGAKQANVQMACNCYFGPCSPGSINTYEWTIHALSVDALQGLDMSSNLATAAAAVEAVSIASASLSGES
jgi:Raf kinase inhibitor-like YbhB/YbcL family protein